MLRREGHVIGRKHVSTLMKKMGIEALYRKPNTSPKHPRNKVYPYLLRGLKITRANHVFHFDRWWNPAVEDQASDRAHRIGQERPVTIYRLIMQDSIEEQILRLHRDKRDLASDLLEGTETTARLSEEALLNLIRA